MKKALILFLALTVGAFMAFAVGCEEPTKEEPEEEEEEEKEPEEEEKEPEEKEFEDVALEDIDGLLAEDMELEDGTYEATDEGYLGGLDVEVTIEDGSIESVEVLDHAESVEEEDYPGAASVNEALDVVPERIVNTGGTDGVDGISEATATSGAIAGAVEKALNEAAVEVEEEEEDEEEEEKEVEEPEEKETYTGVGEGFNDDIELEVTVEEGEITDIEVLSHSETPDFWDGDEAKGIQTIDDIIEAQSTDVDTETGATGSSEGIVEAVEDAVGDIIN